MATLLDQTLEGTLDRITYTNPENGYTVARLTDSEGKNHVVVGVMPGVKAGLQVTLEGEYSDHPRYGLQFTVRQYRETVPATREAMERYLGSGLVKGIGAGFAARIVRAFGEQTLDVLDHHPERLCEVKGLGEKKRKALMEAWTQQREVKDIMLFLQGNGVSPSLAARIYKVYGPASMKVVKTNPYRLADEIHGVGFKTADTLAQKIGFPPDSPFRCRSAVLYVLDEAMQSGHCYLPREVLAGQTAELLGVTAENVEERIEELLMQNRLTATETENGTEGVLFPWVEEYEQSVAEDIARILSKPRLVLPCEPDQVLPGLERDEDQFAAVKRCAEESMLVLTGGPGTGKTTVLMGVLKMLEQAGQRVLLAAPTGKAAKRIAQVTGREARTLHRWLEYKPGVGFMRTQEGHPFDCDAMIVDEASMIDLQLMYHLMHNLPDGCRLYLVGDTDQLPPVGAGNVLSDLLSSGAVPHICLTRIFRQAQQSRIVTNAHRINAGQMPDLTPGPQSDFFFIEQEDAHALAELIVDLVCRRLPGYYGIPGREIQVLCPQYRGPAGVDNLNLRLQEKLNPNGKKLHWRGTEFRVGDKVMQTENNSELDVYNGDMGTVIGADEDAGTITVEVDGGMVTYTGDEIDALRLGYAVSVHKSQGSEFPVVVAPFSMQHYTMLERNLLYTCVTRAKKAMVLVGSAKAVAMAVNRVPAKHRNTRLAWRIGQCCPGVEN